ncbi:MAG: hypothetical protein A2W09_07445 [Deltaproteobacteria bacterium RBG_16_50_11]|nr:MAG: hypothetical protein A2W09_07445 [Deltaproteobacteria bacterium RBG_16_50_11]
MGLKVCLSGSICNKNKSGGIAWLYFTWALGLRDLGCHVIWLEAEYVDPSISEDELKDYLGLIKNQLKQYGLGDCSIALSSRNGESLPWDSSGWYLSLDDIVSEADLFLNLAYHSHPRVVERFRKSALVDTDPGLVQFWISKGQLEMARHDIYFSIGETVGTPAARFPDCGIQWHYTPPPAFLPAWPTYEANSEAPYTTVSNWWGDWVEYQGKTISNEKRTAFLEFLELPSRTSGNLELALTLGPDDVDKKERSLLIQNGWKIFSLWGDTSFTPEGYRKYVQKSRGEFSCAKPFFVLLESSLMFDRTLHYLASGKPAIIQYTGPSRFLPESEGLFRFRNMEEAAAALEKVEADYDRHARAARALAEEYFDARKVINSVLERAL